MSATLERGPLDMPLRAREVCGAFIGEVNLNLGCGRHPLDGWINLDRVAGEGADIVVELGMESIPLEDHSVDCVFASHVLEHIHDIISAMREIHRVLKPGGYLVAAVPHAGHDGAWDDPTHVRAFTGTSFGYFDARVYLIPGQPGFYPSPVDYRFSVVKVDLVPEMDIVASVQREHPLDVEKQHAAIAHLAKYQRNIIMEVRAVLQAIEGL